MLRLRVTTLVLTMLVALQYGTLVPCVLIIIAYFVGRTYGQRN